MFLDAFGFEVLDEQKQSNDPLLMCQQLNNIAGTLWFSRLFMA
jgi:hypothetical protein